MLLCAPLLTPLAFTLEPRVCPARVARWRATATLAPLPRGSLPPMAMAGPPLVPKEIRDAEAKTPAAAGRGLRFTGFAVLGALAVATGVVYLAAAAGIAAVEDLAEALVPFDNLYLGIAVDGGVIATCVWLWKQELNTREENVQRIWAEVQRRRNSPKASKKEQGFTKKRKASRGSAKRDAPPARGAGSGAAGFGSSSGTPPPAPPTPPAPPAAPTPAEIGPPGESTSSNPYLQPYSSLGIERDLEARHTRTRARPLTRTRTRHPQAACRRCGTSSMTRPTRWAARRHNRPPAAL